MFLRVALRERLLVAESSDRGRGERSSSKAAFESHGDRPGRRRRSLSPRAGSAAATTCFVIH